jgi:hypothetical protein
MTGPGDPMSTLLGTGISRKVENCGISIFGWLFCAFMAFVIPACSMDPTPPGPEIAPGTYLQSGYESYRREEGLTVMICQDGIKKSGCKSSTRRQHFIQTSSDIEGCIRSSIPASDNRPMPSEEAARKALLDFFSYLQTGEYELAAGLYGGSYSVMQDHNPDIDPGDRADLFRNACTINGAYCLEIRQATLLEGPSAAEFLFAVQFVKDDGSLFTLAPCCADEDLKADPQDEFQYTVRLECTGRFLVMELPVYSP